MLNRLILLLLLVPVCASAQTEATARDRRTQLQIGVGLPMFWYNGDLTTRRSFQTPRPGIALSAVLESERRITPMALFGYGSLSADDPKLPAVAGIQPNTFVETDFFFFSFMLRARILRTGKWRPHVAAGIGLIQYKTYDAVGQAFQDQVNTRAVGETYNPGGVFFPLQVGVTYRLNPSFTLGFDYTYMSLNTDYIDNIGELGPQEGNDAVHQLQLSAAFVLTRKK